MSSYPLAIRLHSCIILARFSSCRYVMLLRAGMEQSSVAKLRAGRPNGRFRFLAESGFFCVPSVQPGSGVHPDGCWRLLSWTREANSKALVDLQPDAQNSCLFIYIYIYIYIIDLLKSSTYFEHYPTHLQEVYVVTVYICSLWYRHSLQVTVLCTDS